MPATPKSRTRRGRASASPGPVQAQSPATGDVVPGRLTKCEWVTMVTGEEGEEAVAEILDELMRHVMEKCYRVYLGRQLLPFTVSRARDTLVRMLEWQFLMQDRGEGSDSAPLWMEDSEPRPGETDSWADGSVPVHARSPAPPTPTPQVGPHVPQSKSPQRRTAPSGGAAAAPQSRNDIQPMSQAATGRSDPGKEHKETAEEPGTGGIRPRVPPPPKRREGKGKRQPPPETELLALRTPPHALLWGSLPCTPSLDEQDPTAAPVPKSTPIPRPPDVQRLNPKRLPRRFFCPGFEVLKPSPIPLPSRIKAGQQPQAPTPYEGVSKWGSPGGAVCVFSTRNIQDGGPPQGYTPLSASLLLDTMKLSQGVSITGLAKSLKDRPSHPERRAALMPIRGTLSTPLLMQERLILGPPPQVIPLLSPNETMGPV